MKALPCFLILLACSLGHASELSAETKAKAKQHYESAEKAFRLGDFNRAISEFKASYELSAEPLLLYNLGQAYRQTGDAKQALFFYRQFLATGPNGPQRKVAQQKVQELEKVVEEQRKAQESPPAGTADHTPPPPKEAEPAQKPPVEKLNPPSTPLPVPDKPTPRVGAAWYKSAPGWAVFGVGIAAVAVGAGIAAQGESFAERTRTAPTLPERQQAFADANSWRPAGYAVIGVGAAALVASVVVFAVSAKRPSRTAYFAPLPGGGVVGFAGGW